MNNNEEELVNKMVQDYFDTQSLRAVGSKHKVSHEWVRLLFAKYNIDTFAIRKAIKDYKQWHRIMDRYRTCKCGINFHLDVRRERSQILVDKCHKCMVKARYKLEGYRWQKDWAKRHPDKIREYNLRAVKKYIEKHRDELNAKARAKYKAMKKLKSITITN